MTDDTTNRGHADRLRISLNQAHEVRYWTKALGISKAELQAAVKAAGHMAADVRAYLAAQATP